MNTDKKTIYGLSISIFVILFFALFIPFENIKIVFAVLLVGLASAVYFLIKKRSVLDINKGQVSFLFIIIGVLFVVLLYMTGIAFGYYQSLYIFSFKNLLKFILPISVLIISIELIRTILLQQEVKYVNIIAYVIGVVVDLVIFTNLNIFTRFESFINVFGLVFLPSLTSNFMYGYISKKFGMKPNIILRLIITLYSYIIPVVPAIPGVFETILKFIFPIVVYFFIHYLYNKERKLASKKESPLVSYVLLGVVLIFMISVVMIISCKFKYGMIVIATGSMSGEIEVGDAILYESYDNQVVDLQDVIVFKKDDVLVIHRVVRIENIGGELRYYTKGDANESEDAGYRIKSDLVGIVQFKIPYIGFPSIMVRKLFD